MFEEVEKTCSKLAIIKEGKIVAVDDMNTIKKSKTKKYIVKLKTKAEIKKLEKEKLQIIETNETEAKILIQNNVKELIDILGKYDVVDLTEEMQNLEDIFMGYYGGVKND
jgi:ABC-2 type transport system ATP-binding protein